MKLQNSCCTPAQVRKKSLSPVKAEVSAIIGFNQPGQISDSQQMISLPGGTFRMGTDDREGFPLDGEGPVRDVTLNPFLIDRTPVTNDQFKSFIDQTGYRTESEQFGWSFVFQNHITEETRQKNLVRPVPGLKWWYAVSGSRWNQPEGPGSSLEGRENHPVTQLSWNDASAYCQWAGKRLPTEAEWEYAARGGLTGKKYFWGDELTPEGKHMCNIWQGNFPDLDTGEDSYTGTCPVDAFPPNDYGLYSMAGNVWEWCSDWFSPRWHIPEKDSTRINPKGPATGSNKSMRGGSFLCHKSYCNRYRVAARTGNTPDSAAGNLGFRCVKDL